MNKEKQDRLQYLRKEKFLSDEEHNELDELEEEFNLEEDEANNFKSTNINLGTGKGFVAQNKKRSLLDIIIDKLKKKPITFEQIEKLKNERTVAYLKRDIAKANYERRNPGGKPKKTRSSSQNNSIEKEFGSSARDFRNMSGSNDRNKYKDLIG